MSRRVVQDTKGPTEDMDTVPEVQGGWRRPSSGQVGIDARGICSFYRKAFVVILVISISRLVFFRFRQEKLIVIGHKDLKACYQDQLKTWMHGESQILKKWHFRREEYYVAFIGIAFVIMIISIISICNFNFAKSSDELLYICR